MKRRVVLTRCAVPTCGGFPNITGRCPAHSGRNARLGGKPTNRQRRIENARSA